MVRSRAEVARAVVALVLGPVVIGCGGGGTPAPAKPGGQEAGASEPSKPLDAEGKRHAAAVAIIPEGTSCLPLALNDAVNDGKLKKGDLILLASVGAGFTVGSVLVRWSF